MGGKIASAIIGSSIGIGLGNLLNNWMHNESEGETPEESPTINPDDISGKTPDEIDEIAKDAGLIPKGPDPKNGKDSYDDPETGKQRILIHPKPKRGGPHSHVNDPQGERLGPGGIKVPTESPEAHLPLNCPNP